MFKAIGCLGVFFFIIFILLFRVFGSIIQALRGDNPSRKRKYHCSCENESSTTTHTKTRRKKKVIPDNEGEYIEYEEVDDKK